MSLKNPLTAKQLKERDAKRNIDAELLQAVRDLKTGKGKAASSIKKPKQMR